MSKRCAFLSMQSLEGYVSDHELLFEPLQELGWQVELVPWQERGVDWERYTAVYLCCPWDYPTAAAEFLARLEEVERSSALLVNDLALVRWSLPKTYLADLEQRGAAIVPTLWRTGFPARAFGQHFDELRTSRLIVKPVVSTNATDTFLLDREANSAELARLEDLFEGRDVLIQPFLANVQSEGEFSLFYFGGSYSHAILKTPKARDFRVQEEHGGTLQAVEPSAALRRAADHALGLVAPEPVYARVDLVRSDADEFQLMELELIEPSLYLRLDREAPRRFARSFDRHVQERGRAASSAP